MSGPDADGRYGTDGKDYDRGFVSMPPERIWAASNGGWGSEFSDTHYDPVEYVRLDLVEKLKSVGQHDEGTDSM